MLVKRESSVPMTMEERDRVAASGRRWPAKRRGSHQRAQYTASETVVLLVAGLAFVDGFIHIVAAVDHFDPAVVAALEAALARQTPAAEQHAGDQAANGVRALA